MNIVVRMFKGFIQILKDMVVHGPFYNVSTLGFFIVGALFYLTTLILTVIIILDFFRRK